VTFPTALKTEITAKGDIIYSEVVRELIALNVVTPRNGFELVHGAHSVKYTDLVRDCKFDKHPMLSASGYSADCTELWIVSGELMGS
jgi:hypothetical protein